MVYYFCFVLKTDSPKEPALININKVYYKSHLVIVLGIAISKITGSISNTFYCFILENKIQIGILVIQSTISYLFMFITKYANKSIRVRDTYISERLIKASEAQACLCLETLHVLGSILLKEM